MIDLIENGCQTVSLARDFVILKYLQHTESRIISQINQWRAIPAIDTSSVASTPRVFSRGSPGFSIFQMRWRSVPEPEIARLLV